MKQSRTILLAALVVLALACAALLYRSQTAPVHEQTAAPAVSTAAQMDTAGEEGSDPVSAADTDAELATDFSVYTYEGESVRLSDFFGKPIVLNFWATWCPPCRMEMPCLEDAYVRYGEDVVFMLVDVTDGQQDTSETVQAFIEENGYSFPVYLDPMLDATRAYSVYSIPMTVFIDTQGAVQSTHVGSMTAEKLEAGIREIYTPAQ